MTTGIPNVSNLPLWYKIITLLILLCFAVYDYRHHLVRNSALIAFLPWCLLSLPIVLSCTPLFSFVILLLRSFLGFLSGALLLLSVSLLTHGGIGGGDIKLVALLGIILGSYASFLTVAAAALFALLYIGILTIFCRPPERIPFVPFLFLGFILIIFN